MHARDEPCALTIRVVILEQQFSSLLIQRGLGIGVDEQALHREKDVAYSISRLPVFLERVHTNLACRRDIRMEDLGREPTYEGQL